MFPLKTDTLPANADDFARRLNESLRDLFKLERDPVQLREISYPHLASLVVSLDDARLPSRPPALPSLAGQPAPAVRIDSFVVNGSGLSVGPASMDFALTAQGVVLHHAADREGHVVLLLHQAAEGRVEISVSLTNLEALIAEVAKSEAGKHGVIIDGVQLSLHSKSPGSLAAEVSLRAKKLFFSTSLRVTGQLDLDEELNVRISGLNCTGEGAIASVACGVLKPHLEKLEGRDFPLMSLPLREVHLRDVRIAVGDKLTVTAEFGSAAA
jgi:hypothetical protein